jgi:2-polyprenyl-3-methyl-5-hydroxy-6-metoxy-1,4-benzoquinol methylase
MVMSHTDLNGFLNTGQMHLLSTQQCYALLAPEDKKGEAKTTTAKHAAESKTATTTTTSTTSTDTDNDDDDDDDDSDSDDTMAMPGLEEQEVDLEQASLLSNTTRLASISGAKPLKFARLLDVGAGDGRVTLQLAPLFKEVVCTEASKQMCVNLRKKGFSVAQTIDVKTGLSAAQRGDGFDVICLLNVLDRCMRPRTLLHELRALMRNADSMLVLATPLPLHPAVEVDGKWLSPKECIMPPQYISNADSLAWEKSLAALIDNVIRPCGYDLVRFARIPYVSQGDHRHAYYVLDDVVLVLRQTPDFKLGVHDILPCPYCKKEATKKAALDAAKIAWHANDKKT